MAERQHRDWREISFIDAFKLGRMVDRTHRELTDDEIARVARTYHAWRGCSTARPRPIPPIPFREFLPPGFTTAATK